MSGRVESREEVSWSSREASEGGSPQTFRLSRVVEKEGASAAGRDLDRDLDRGLDRDLDRDFDREAEGEDCGRLRFEDMQDGWI